MLPSVASTGTRVIGGFLLLLVPGCASDSNPEKPSQHATGGASGSSSGSGGSQMPSQTGGAAPASGGVSGGGGIAGTGGLAPSSGGTSAETGGATAGTGGSDDAAAPSPLDGFLSPDKSYFIKEPPGDKPVGPDSPDADFCFNLVAHDAQLPLASDPRPFSVRAGDSYRAFEFADPAHKPAWVLSARPIITNANALHRWQLFVFEGDGKDGQHYDIVGPQSGPVIAVWVPGEDSLVLPPKVGLELPSTPSFFRLESHYENAGSGSQTDRSGVRVCVTYTKPEIPASVAYLGTELIDIAPGGQSQADGTCTSWKKDRDVHLIQAVPQMHRLGSRMQIVVNRSSGGQDVVIDQPFGFGDEQAYPLDVVVRPGDTLTTTCTYDNPTSGAVKFGFQPSQELCYALVITYPLHALSGIGGLAGYADWCLF